MILNKPTTKWIKYLPILFLALLFSFAPNPKPKHTHIVDLPDSCFAYKHFTNTSVVKGWLNRHPFAHHLKDTTKEIKLYSLDTTQMRKIMPSIVDRAVVSSGIGYDMGCELVARQDKIGAFTPIIFLVTNWDYWELMYVMLDKNDNPVSHFLLAGGLCGGPSIETDTLFALCPFKVSHINGNIISSYILHTQWKRDDSLTIVDSVSYKTMVNKTGEIKTSRIDSVRYRRIWPDKSRNPFSQELFYRKKSPK